jgi:hypothetical protein
VLIVSLPIALELKIEKKIFKWRPGFSASRARMSCHNIMTASMKMSKN